MNIGVRPRFIRKSDFFYAWLAATLLSGIPSTLYAVATGRDAMEATRAAAAMFPLSGNAVIDAALVHTAVSLFWAALLALALPARHTTAWAVGAAAMIGSSTCA